MAEAELSARLIIIGSGPAAHTAAIYAARAELAPLLFEGFNAGGIAAGGQLTTTSNVENFPGFPDGIGGIELTQRFRQQSLNSGVRIKTETIDRVELNQQPFTVFAGETALTTQALIIATGATAKRLGVPGEEQYWQQGVSACAVCDGPLPLFRGQPLFVIGGGDTACEEALFLTKYASQVTLVHRRDALRASAVMQRRVQAAAKLDILWNHELVRLSGEKTLQTVTLRDSRSGLEQKQAAAGLFYAVGHRPNTEFLGNALALDDAGYLLIQTGAAGTSIPGVFAAGDVHDKQYRQAITAAGSGCMAFFEAQAFLNETA